MNRRDFLRFLGGAAATAAVAPKALAGMLDGSTGIQGFQGPTGPEGPAGFQGSLAPGFIVLEPGMSIQDAIDALPKEGGTVYVQSGTWIVDQAIEIPKDVTLMMQGNITISGCRIRGQAREKGDSPIWMLMEDDDQVAIIGNTFDCEHVQSLNSWFYAPIGEELERVKRGIFDLYLRFKKLVV